MSGRQTFHFKQVDITFTSSMVLQLDVDAHELVVKAPTFKVRVSSDGTVTRNGTTVRTASAAVDLTKLKL